MELTQYTILFTALSALGALIAAIGSLLSSRATRKSVEAQVLCKFFDEYSNIKMSDSLRTLRSWEFKYKDNFADIWKRELVKKNPEAIKVDKARRHVSHFFIKAFKLYSGGYMKKKFIYNICELAGITIFLKVVEPLEEALNSNYGKESFKVLRKIANNNNVSGVKIRPMPA